MKILKELNLQDPLHSGYLTSMEGVLEDIFAGYVLLDATKVSKTHILGITSENSSKTPPNTEPLLPIIYISAKASDLFHVTNRKAPSTFAETLLSPETVLELNTGCLKALQDKKSQVITLAIAIGSDTKWLNTYILALPNRLLLAFEDATKAIQLEHKLNSSEDRFQSLVRTVPGIIYEWYICHNGHTGFSYVSPSLDDLDYGITAKGVMEYWQNCFKIHPDDEIVFHENVKTATENQSEFTQELRVTLNSGRKVVLECRARPTRFEDDRTVFTGMFLDITKQKLDRTELERTQEMVRLFANNVSDLISLHDAHGKYLYITPSSERLLGVPDFDFSGLSGDALVYQEDRCKLMRAGELSIRQPDTTQTVRYRMQTHSGQWRWFQAILKGVEDPTSKVVTKFIRSARDIHLQVETEREMVQTKEMLEQQTLELVALTDSLESSRQSLLTIQERYDLAISGTNDGIFDWNFLTNDVYYSPVWYQILGYDIDEMPHQLESWSTLVHPEDLPKTLNAIELHKAGKTELYQNRHRLKSKNGDWIWVWAKGKVVRNTQGEATRMVGTIMNIQDRVEQEEALKLARNEAESANKAKSQFLAIMSHELRTPMTGIMGTLDLLKESPLTSDQIHLLNIMGNSAKSLLNLLNDILDFSKVEAGQLALEHTRFDIFTLVRDVVELFAATASIKGTRLELSMPKVYQRKLVGDSTRIRQVLFNLIGNAVKFTEGGKVDLILKQDTGQALGTSDPSDYVLHFSIKDTGVGMDEHILESIFSPFVQSDTTISRKYGGTGLGLSICKQLVELMGGQIGVESKRDEGSTFWFTIPVITDTSIDSMMDSPKPISAAPFKHSIESVSNAPTTAAVSPAQCFKVLVAEDNETNRLIIKTMLERLGHSVTLAENGAIACEAVLFEGFDIILMDMQMPIMDGESATRTIRTLPAPKSQIPIVALTADAMPEHHKVYMESGLNEILTKPIKREVLEAALQKHVVQNTLDNGTIVSDTTETNLESLEYFMPEAIESNDTSVLETFRDGLINIPIHDTDQIASLVEFIGIEKMQELMQQFLDSVPETMLEIAKAKSDQNWDGFRKICHTMKGASLNIGFKRIGEICQYLNYETKGFDDAEALLIDLTDAITASNAAPKIV